jgi:hypothetical protein
VGVVHRALGGDGEVLTRVAGAVQDDRLADPLALPQHIEHLVSSALNLHYHALEAYEIQYTPDGVDSGLCVSVGSTPVNGTPVTLESCGVSAKTVRVVDSFKTIGGFYVPLINGADTNFSHPYVLHYPGTAYPTDSPRPQLNTWTLQTYANGTVFDNEMWGANFGVLK